MTECPTTAKDRKCEGVLDCVDGEPFTLAQLDSLAGFAEGLSSARENLGFSKSLISGSDVLDFRWQGSASEPGPGAEPAPTPTVSPSPSPRPSGYLF